MDNTIQKPFLTLKEAAEFLSVKDTTMYQIVKEKRIPFSKPGGKNIYFFKEDLMKYIEDSKVN